MKTKLLLPLLGLGLAGCNLVDAPLFEASSQKSDIHVMRYSAVDRGAYIIKGKDGMVRVVAEPPPDAAKEYLTSIEASVKDAKDTVGQAEAKLLTATNIAALAKRSQSLQIARELAYRMNEASAMGVMDEKTSAHYSELLTLVGEMMKAELLAGQADEKRSQAALISAKAGLINARLKLLEEMGKADAGNEEVKKLKAATLDSLLKSQTEEERQQATLLSAKTALIKEYNEALATFKKNTPQDTAAIKRLEDAIAALADGK